MSEASQLCLSKFISKLFSLIYSFLIFSRSLILKILASSTQPPPKLLQGNFVSKLIPDPLHPGRSCCLNTGFNTVLIYS